MYDYQKNEEQLSNENDIATFQGGENISSDFKLKREKLPQWAVDWARNRFNMDVKNVKFYVMDEQDPDEPYAAASGNSVFVSSEYRNDETIIKHELTHIYQQAIGMATEGNAEDASLEEEAVQVSQEREFSLAKNQAQSNRYILPREKTNVVQSFGVVAIIGFIIDAFTIGKFVYLLVKLKRCKNIAKKTKLPTKTVCNIYSMFSWVKHNFQYTKHIEKLCSVVAEKKIKIDTLKEDSKIMKKYSESFFGDKNIILDKYANMLSEGFNGFCNEVDTILSFFGVHLNQENNEDAAENNGAKKENMNNAYEHVGENLWDYANLYIKTNGFSSKVRDMEQVKDDIKNIFGVDTLDSIGSENISQVIQSYINIFGINNEFKIKSEDIKANWERITGKSPDIKECENIFKILKYTGCFVKIPPDDFNIKRDKLAEALSIKQGTHAWKKFKLDIMIKLLEYTEGFKDGIEKVIEQLEKRRKKLDVFYRFEEIKAGKAEWNNSDLMMLIEDYRCNYH